MNLYLYNTLNKSKILFKPIDPNKIGMYVCGPTVYDYPHLGNALAVVIYDVLFRLLKIIYGKDKITYVRNITDIDDKIINAANKKNISITELSEEITNIFQQNMSKLNCLDPIIEPKATNHIQEMIAMIDKLIANDHAYISNSHVYFKVSSFAEYGRLSGRNLTELIAGARVEVADGKENPADFVLWKPSEDRNASFPSPYGNGRPGWHIECSAMSSKYLGDNFDIHGGGIDLIFPHHSNEIAQSCCASPGSSYANYWVHNGFLTVNGEKMSKSLGNFITIEELLNQDIHGEVIRYILLNSHYRKPIDWTDKAVFDAKKALDSFYRVLQNINLPHAEVPQEFLDYLLDDLNTPGCFALMHEYTNVFNKSKNLKIAAQLKACGEMIGFFTEDPDKWFTGDSSGSEYIEEQIQKRIAAKKAKNWQLADEIREELKKQNIILEDKADGNCTYRKI
jgi:cysteinyl-tRNA synthetase